MQTLSQKGGNKGQIGKKKAPTEMDFKKKYKTEVNFVHFHCWFFMLENSSCLKKKKKYLFYFLDVS